MFDSKSKVVKVVGYFILGFFGLIIVISFGMPDFVSKIGLDNSIAAVVNGEKIHAFEYFRFRDRYRDSLARETKDKKNIEDTIFKNFIGEILLLQKTKELGFEVSEDRILRTLRNMKEFQNPNTGKFDLELYKLVLRQNNMSSTEFSKLIKHSLLKEEFFRFLQMGVAVSRDEMHSDILANNTKIQIKYSYLSRKELEKRFSDKISVSETEITEDLTKNSKEVKDPKTDRERIKNKLIKKKLENGINELITAINAETGKKAAFDQLSEILKGTIGESRVFKIGEEVVDKGKDARPLQEISNSKIFRETCLSLKKGESSKIIDSPSGLYIFTPILLEMDSKIPSETEIGTLEKLNEYEKLDSITRNVMTAISEKSKIVKNIKTD